MNANFVFSLVVCLSAGLVLSLIGGALGLGGCAFVLFNFFAVTLLWLSLLAHKEKRVGYANYFAAAASSLCLLNVLVFSFLAENDVIVVFAGLLLMASLVRLCKARNVVESDGFGDIVW